MNSGTQAGSRDQGSEKPRRSLIEVTQRSTLYRGGRPENWFKWSHYKDTDAEDNKNRKKFQCKHCDLHDESQVENPHEHCQKECKDWPQN